MNELKRYPMRESELRVVLELKQFVEIKLDRLADETIFWEDERIKLCQREERCK